MVKKVTAILHRKNSLASASIILIITLTLSNFLGVIRDHYLTQKIPTDLLSVYYAAFRIPDLIFNILILGAITSAFIPIFTNLIAREKEDEAWEVTASVINIALVFLVGLSIILAIFMPYITPFVVPGFSPERQQLTASLARIMLLSPIFFGLSYILGGILNSYKRFLVYALAPLVYNLAIILGTLLFADKIGVVGVAISVVAGAFLHFLIQLPVAIRLGLKFKLKIAWKHWGVQRIGLLMIPRAIALGANQIMLLIFTSIASALGGYSIAVYNLADNIQTMPMVVFGTSFATAIFPTLSEAISHNKYDDFSGQIKKMIRTILFFMVPMALIFIILRMQIVRLILGSGNFGWEQTIVTANTLAIFSFSLIFTGLTPLLSRSFYALHNTRVPMIITIASVIVSIILGKIFSLKMGVVGLALGYTIGSIATTIALYLMLRGPAKITKELEIWQFIAKVVFATVLTGLAMHGAILGANLFVDLHHFWGVAIQTLIALGVGLIVYLLVTHWFGLEEIKAISFVWQKYSRRNLVERENES